MRNGRSVFATALGFLLVVSFFGPVVFSNTEATDQPSDPVKLSHARVVRLSFIEGTVTLRRPGTSDSSAVVNDPIQEGFSLATSGNSFAEVEFENGSTIQLGELTAVEFTQLALTPEGGHINHLTLDEGYATLHVVPIRHDDYRLGVSGLTLAPRGKTEFRADLNQEGLRVEVFDGRVQAGGANFSETLAKNHTLIRDLDPDSAFQINDKIQKDEWDKWADAREQQSSLAFNHAAVGPAAPVFGWADLDTYGEWSYYPGYGNAWTPYEPLGWSPYSDGMWDWYPDMGYTWISGEPWGWLPFHYGYWNFNPGMGWFWMPGSSGAWNPALVNWYSGPGWVGWTPVGAAGAGGRAPCTLAAAGCLTAAPPGYLGNRQPIRPGDPHLIHPPSNVAITAIARPAVVPIRPTVSSRPSSSRVVENPSGRNGEEAESVERHGPKSAFTATGFTRGRTGAPSSVLLGRKISVESLVGHHSAAGGASHDREPIRVRLGGTMGGRFPAATGGRSEWRAMLAGGETRRNRGEPSTSGGPQILTRAANGGPSGAGGGFRSGGVSRGIAVSGGARGGGASGGSHGGGSSGGGHR